MKWLRPVLAILAIAVSVPAFAQQSAPKPQTLFTNVNVFDGVNEKRIMNANVLVEGNLIKEVSTAKIDAPGATVIDGGGRTLMPGLIDAHWHTMFNFWPISKIMGVNFGALSIAAAKHSGEQLLRASPRCATWAAMSLG
jgi:imidazolonepropionase-like amidohydrolase